MMKIKSILLLSTLAISIALVSCNNKPKQGNPREPQKEQVENRMNHNQRGPHQSERMNKSVKDRSNQGISNFDMRLLTKEQKESFKTIRMACMKEIQPLKDQLNELKLHEKTLMKADKPDLNAIYTNIDKISSLENKIAKIFAKSKIEMYKQLTSEQKLKMNNMKRHDVKQKKGHDKNMKHGKNRSQRH